MKVISIYSMLLHRNQLWTILQQNRKKKLWWSTPLTDILVELCLAVAQMHSCVFIYIYRVFNYDNNLSSCNFSCGNLLFFFISEMSLHKVTQ